MMHAENGIAIDVLVAQALAEGKTDPLYHGLTRPPALRGRGHPPGDRSWPQVAGVAGLHRAPVGARRRWPRSPRPATPGCTSSPRPARSTCTCPWTTWPGRASRAPSTSARRRCGPRAPGRAVARPAHRRPAGGLHRPLPVLLQGPEGAGPRRLLQDPQRAARRRGPDGPAVPGRWRTGTFAGRAGSRSPARPRPGCSASTRARARSRRAPTPTSWSTTRTPRRSCRRRRTT